ncbi:polysaccharide deacetylase family protein [Arthrobacter sp. Hz1]
MANMRSVGANGLKSITSAELVDRVDDWLEAIVAVDNALNAVKWDKGVNTADLNTIQASGRWTQNATTTPNLPLAVSGDLVVAWGATTGVQRYTTREAMPRVYRRSYQAAAWGAWDFAYGRGVAESKTYTDERDEAYRTVDRALWRSEDDGHQAAAEAAAKAYTDAQVLLDRNRLTPLEADKWNKGEVPVGTNLDTWYAAANAGAWKISSAPSTRTITGLPTGEDALGSFVVDPGIGFQTYKTYATGKIWYRVLISITSKAWSVWKDLAVTPILNRGGIPNNAALDTWYTAAFDGRWSIGSTTSANTMTGLPISSAGNFWVSNAGGNIASQVFQAYTGAGYWVRSITSLTGPTWSAWKDLTAEPPAPTVPPDYALRHQIKAQSAKALSGGVLGTGGLPFIVLRFDDWHAAFRTKVADVLRANNLPCIMACTINNIVADSTYPEIQSWHINDGFAVIAHSYTHGPASTEAELTREIVDSADVMEANMNLLVLKWAMPGTGAAVPYGGYYGATEADFHSTIAGNLLMSRYGIVYGARGGHLAPQGGHVLGQGHVTYEKSTLEAFQGLVNAAKKGAYSQVMMLHPGQLDNTVDGYMTTATFTACMQWLAAERDAGRIMIGTANAIPALTPTSTYRHNLLSGSFTTLDGWFGTGWTAAGGIATSPASTAALSTNGRWDASKSLQGGTRETHVVVRSAAANSVKVRLAGGTIIATEKTFAIPGDGAWHDLRKFFTIPASGLNGVDIFINSTTGVTFDVREANMWAA